MDEKRTPRNEYLYFAQERSTPFFFFSGIAFGGGELAGNVE